MALPTYGQFGAVASVDTTNATPTTIASFTVAEGVRLQFTGVLIGWCAATDEIAVLSFEGGARRAVGGNVNVPAVLQGSSGAGEGSINGCSVLAVGSNPDTVNVQVTGVSGATITWNCGGRTVEQS